MSALPQPAAPRPRGWKVRRGRALRARKRPVYPWLLALLLVLGWLWTQPPLQRWRYPLAYRELVLQEARRAGLRPELVAAVILQESEFCPQASSRVGARGLMQLMPETGRWVHAELEGRAGEPDLWQPETNVRLGSTYLGYLSERFGGAEVAVLSAYNAGPQYTLEWLAASGGKQLGLDDIPFPETRAYVEAVLESERMYRRLYPEMKGLNDE